MAEIIILDYGMGNLGSVFNMFKKIGVNAKISNNIKEVEKAKKILLPGVGAFDTAIQKIEDNNFSEILNYKAKEEKIPILGICLGMQLLTYKSEEGNLAGFGWIDAETKKFKFELEDNFKVPHMGWNHVIKNNESPIIEKINESSKFYFVHSYFVQVNNNESSIMKAHHGQDFDAIISNGENIFGAQFHPEKSHKFGMQFLTNFATL